FVDLGEKDYDVGRAGRGHAVFFLPEDVILVPLPDVATKCRLGIDFELVYVYVAAKNLNGRFCDAPVSIQSLKGVTIELRAVNRTNVAASLLHNPAGAGACEHSGQLRPHDLDFRF